MNINDLSENQDFKKFVTTIAVGYAKRIMGKPYDQIMETKLGKGINELNRPNKYLIEASLNGLVSYLATNESQFVNTPVKQVLWELTKDFPSEIARRIIDSDSQLKNEIHPDFEIKVDKIEQALLIESLLKMKSEDLDEFLRMLKTSTPEERYVMAEDITKLTEEEHSKLTDISSVQEKNQNEEMISAEKVFQSQSKAQEEPPKIKSGLTLLTSELRSFNDKLENRKGQA